MRIDRFEDIIAWQKANELTLEIYRLFKENRDFAFREQIQKASVSIMNNIAEGFERGSNSDFRRFLFIAKGSCGEVRSMLYLAKALEYCTGSQFEEMYRHSVEISRTISGLIKTLDN